MNRRRVVTGAMLAPLLLPACTRASQGDAAGFDSGFSSNKPASYLTPAQAAAFAKQVEADLSARGARLAIVFRTGRPRDKLPAGISYTHGAFWAHTPVKTADGGAITNGADAYAVLNLYHGDGKAALRTRSTLVQDWPIDFVAGTAVDDFAVLLPTPALQQDILAAIASPLYEKMHVTEYSLIANPLDARYQNCNEFMLDVMCAALWKTDDYAAIKSRQKESYTPTPIDVKWYERALGPLTDSRVRLEDQGERIVTATYESMAAFMKAEGALAGNYTIVRNESEMPAASATPAP